MKKLLFILLVLAELIISAQPVFGQTPASTGSSAVLKSTQVKPDNRQEILAIFLKKYNSPLVPYASEFVAAADAYGLDWKLVPAITGVESTFGKRIPSNSYNGYGWNNGAWKFKSWKDSIWHVNSKLKTKYLNKGAVSVYQIARIYAPPSSTWAGKVNHFMSQIEATPDFNLDL